MGSSKIFFDAPRTWAGWGGPRQVGNSEWRKAPEIKVECNPAPPLGGRRARGTKRREKLAFPLQSGANRAPEADSWQEGPGKSAGG